MNEEVVIKFGTDLSGVGSGLRSLKGMLNEAKKDAEGLGDALKSFGKGALAFAGIGVGASAMIEGAKAAMEYAKHITILSDEIGVSTKTLQQFEYAARKTGAGTEAADKTLQKLAETVGKARMGEDASIKVLERWGIAIYDANGHSRSMDEILDSVAEKMRSATDPTIQNAMAMELGGKSAKNLVEALKNLDEFKQKSEGKILSESELATLENAERTVKSIGGWLKSVSTHAFAAVLSPFFNNDADALKKKLEKSDFNATENSKPTEAQIKEAKEMAKALQELHRAQAGEGVQDKWLAARLKVGELEKESAAAKDGSVEKVKIETALVKARGELEKAAAEDKKKADHDEVERKKQVDRDEKRRQKDKDQALRDEAQYKHLISLAERSAQTAARNQREGFQDQSKYSLQELAEIGRNKFYSGNGRNETYAERTAIDIQDLESRVKDARDYGNTDYADQLQGRANELRKSVGYAVGANESDPMRQFAEATTKAEAHLKWIKEKGIAIVKFPGMDDESGGAQ